jgi:hypothetical protein
MTGPSLAYPSRSPLPFSPARAAVANRVATYVLTHQVRTAAPNDPIVRGSKVLADSSDSPTASSYRLFQAAARFLWRFAGVSRFMKSTLLGSHARLLAAVLVIGLGTVLLGPRAASAQASWEYSPYRNQVWIAFGPSPDLNAEVRDRVAQELVLRSQAILGPCWDLNIAEPPGELAVDLALDVELLAASELETHAEKSLLENDKLFLVQLGTNPRETVIRVREVDCRTRHLGPVIERRLRQSDRLAAETFSALVQSFAPLVRIESGEEKTLVTRLRAGGLILDPESPAYVDTGDVLQPIVRRNDRLGKPTRIDVVDWTFLEVTKRNETNPNLLECHVHSAMRSPIRGRGGSRREQYALGLRLTFPNTRIDVLAQVPSKETPYALPGLEVYAKRPSTAPPPQTPEEKVAEAKANPAELLGYTDWRGSYTVQPGDQPLRIVYLKNGGQLLRRLPIVPGLQPTHRIEVPDDDPRLMAEGFIRGFHGEIMDLVAQRKILEVRIRKRIEESKVEEATQLIAELRSLPSRSDMARRLDQAQNRQIKSPNRFVQGHIDTMYGDTRTMLNQYLNPDLPNQLNAELNKVAGGP